MSFSDARSFPGRVRHPSAPQMVRGKPGLPDLPVSDRYWRLHSACVVGSLALLSAWLMHWGGDFAVADALYALQGGEWAFKTAWLTEDVIHIAGRNLSILIWMTVTLAWALKRSRDQDSSWRRPLAYLALATLAGVAATAMLKAVSPLDCPWDLSRYGGTRDFFGLFSARPDGMGGGGCFPAGHASGGYAWVALYFFFASTKPALRHWGLAVGLSAGLLFGVSQQFRGAHFLSHDLWTAAICWLVALWIHRQMFRPRKLLGSHRLEESHGG